MGIISYGLRGNFKKFYDKLKTVSKENKISMPWLLSDFIKCFIKMKCGYSDYLNYKMYLRTKEQRKEYVSIIDEDKFYEIVSPSEFKTFFTIKPNFLNNFKDYINRDFYLPTDESKLEEFIKKHKEFMYKPVDGLGGHGIKKMKADEIEEVSKFYEKIKNENCFLEEYIVQHSEMNSLCPNSVNTIRIMTFANDGKSEILFAGLRVGNGINNVDNFHQGGMGVLVNVDNGKLIGNAFTKELLQHEKHPTTGVEFNGFQIPNWEYIVDMVLRAALVNPNIHVVGWDVAVTENGATFVEGNRRPGFDLVQVLYDKGRKDIMYHCLNKLSETTGKEYTV
ncbi:MAG: hypothetical protein IKV94_01095 [Clostridia bacterium]|nr:hypothetical protein [Clostridia bacterium]